MSGFNLLLPVHVYVVYITTCICMFVRGLNDGRAIYDQEYSPLLNKHLSLLLSNGTV